MKPYFFSQVGGLRQHKDSGLVQDAVMDQSVVQAMQQWPNVPDVYGWLSLDRRGRWLLRGETITNPKLIDFIGRNYVRLDDGSYVFQNGPQRVHVALEATPWIFHVTADNPLRLRDHTGHDVSDLTAVWLTELGQLIFGTERGPGMLVDQDLIFFLSRFTLKGQPGATEEQLAEAMSEPERSGLQLCWAEEYWPVQALPSRAMAGVLGFKTPG